MFEPIRDMTIHVDGLEVVFTRPFARPRDALFRAWTDPARIARWWGPHGFTIPACEVDLRPGGAYRIVMRAPDGNDYPMSGEYLEIAEPEKLVFTDSLHDRPDGWFDEDDAFPKRELRWTVTFAERDGGTTLAVGTAFQSARDRDAMMGFGLPEGWAQSFEKLDRLLKAKA